MNLDKIQEAYRKTDEIIGLKSERMQRFLARKETRKVTNIITSFTLLLLLIVLIILVNTTKNVTKYLGDQVSYDTVYVERIVEVLPDICPACSKALTVKIGKDPYECPFCRKPLIRVNGTGEIFILER